MTELQQNILKYFKLQYIKHGKTYPAIPQKDIIDYKLDGMWAENMYYKLGIYYFFGDAWEELKNKEMFTYVTGSGKNTMPDHLIELFDKI